MGIPPTLACCTTEHQGWWYGREVYPYPEEGTFLTSKFQVTSVTFFGHSRNTKTPNYDNWECTIRGRSVTLTHTRTHSHSCADVKQFWPTNSNLECTYPKPFHIVFCDTLTLTLTHLTNNSEVLPEDPASASPTKRRRRSKKPQAVSRADHLAVLIKELKNSR